MYYLRFFLSLAVLIQSAITAPTPTPTPTNFLEPFETFFRSQQKTKSSASSVNLRPAAHPNTKVRSIEHRGGAFTKDRNYFEEFKIPSDFGNNFPEFSEIPQSVNKETGNHQTDRIPQKNEYYSYSFSTPVEDVSGDDVIAVVNVKHSPKVYFYQVAEAGPRHLKVMYFTGFPSRQRSSNTRASPTN